LLKVLITGGIDQSGEPSLGNSINMAELYNSTAKMFISSSLQYSRQKDTH